MKIDLNRYPYEMSGGQQQLVSIMRALVVEPEVLFLDEPFSALDYEMTLFMRDQLQRIFEETGTTMVLVSHDLEEAVYLADYVLLLSRRPGRIADFPGVPMARPRNDTHLVATGIRRSEGPLPADFSARGAPVTTHALRQISAVDRRRRADRRLVCRLLGAHRRSGAAAAAGRSLQSAVEGHDGRARCCSISAQTVIRTFTAIAVAAVIAIPLGIVLGSSERLYRSVEFVIDFFRSTPASAMFPLFLVIFGVGNATKIYVASFGAALGDPVQCRLWRDECAQDPHPRGAGDGRVAAGR